MRHGKRPPTALVSQIRNHCTTAIITKKSRNLAKAIHLLCQVPAFPYQKELSVSPFYNYFTLTFFSPLKSPLTIFFPCFSKAQIR